jgi:4a-hydroxytetrahydrobiopterin dehydratase
MAASLAEKKCAPCEKGTEPMSPETIRELVRQLPGWQVYRNRILRRELVLKDFVEAVRLILEIARVAEKEDHHPDIHLTNYRKLAIELSTHSIGGLSENDFILAAKIDALPFEAKKA